MHIEDQEKHADPLDHASMISEQHCADRVQEISRLAAPEQVQNPDGTWPITECVSCGDDLIPQRLAHGFVRCVPCKTRLEKARNGLG